MVPYLSPLIFIYVCVRWSIKSTFKKFYLAIIGNTVFFFNQVYHRSSFIKVEWKIIRLRWLTPSFSFLFWWIFNISLLTRPTFKFWTIKKLFSFASLPTFPSQFDHKTLFIFWGSKALFVRWHEFFILRSRNICESLFNSRNFHSIVSLFKQQMSTPQKILNWYVQFY